MGRKRKRGPCGPLFAPIAGGVQQSRRGKRLLSCRRPRGGRAGLRGRSGRREPGRHRGRPARVGARAARQARPGSGRQVRRGALALLFAVSSAALAQGAPRLSVEPVFAAWRTGDVAALRVQVENDGPAARFVLSAGTLGVEGRPLEGRHPGEGAGAHDDPGARVPLRTGVPEGEGAGDGRDRLGQLRHRLVGAVLHVDLRDVGVVSDLERHRDDRIAVVGVGKEEFRLKALVKQLKLQESVKFYGYQANPYVYMKAADWFVLSSISR